jgi:glycine oxidase
MERIAIVGCGIIGAMIAYELSLLDRFDIDVFDASTPASGSTGAALGVLMGIISHKVKGRAWQLREQSIDRYRRLIPELEQQTGLTIPYNDRGIFKLLPKDTDLTRWQQLAATRQQQGWELAIWERDRILTDLPQLNPDLVNYGIYSPQDLQIQPIPLVHALVTAAQSRGVKFHFHSPIINLSSVDRSYLLELNNSEHQCDRLIITAGLGSSQLSANLQHQISLTSVWGQAHCYDLEYSIGNPDFNPVISYQDIHLVPVGLARYWVGATVEFLTAQIQPNPLVLKELTAQAIELCPALTAGVITNTWQGIRPRPSNRPAPIIESIDPEGRAILATGHYRNGVLLAPATAALVSEYTFELG